MLKFIASLDDAEWSAALAKLPESCRDVYFLPEYHRLHAINGDGSAFCTAVRESDEMLMVPGMKMSIPGYQYFDLQTCNGYGGPVATPGASREFLERAWDEWRRQSCRQGIVAAFFRLHPLLNNERFLPQAARIVHDRQTIYLDLSGGVEALWGGATSRYRNMINKARRQRLEVRWNDPAVWGQFEGFYGQSMDRLNAPAALRFSKPYFEALRSMPMAEVASVQCEAEMTAASVFLFGPRWGHFHLSARLPDAGNHLQSGILHSAIERAVARGIEGIHLGGGRTSAPDDQLLHFKSSTGGTTKEFKIALVVADPGKYQDLIDAWRNAAGRDPDWLLGYRQPVGAEPVH